MQSAVAAWPDLAAGTRSRRAETSNADFLQMLQRDDLASIFRIWSNLIGLVAGLAIGHTQMILGAPLWILILSVVVGLIAGEMTFRRSLRPDAQTSPLSRRVALFAGGAGAGGMSALMSQTVHLGVDSGALVVGMLALVLFAVYLGSSAGLGAMTGSALGILYWVIPPHDSFAIADANAAFQLLTTLACCAIAFGMIWAQRKLNATSLEP